MTVIHAQLALTAEGWRPAQQLRIDADGRIAAIGAQDRRADVHCDVLLPAPVNLHSHTFQRAMAGLSEGRGPEGRDSFWSWRQLMYRFLQQLTPAQLEAIAALALMEMAEAGYSAVAEFHYLHHGADGQPYADLAELSARVIQAAQSTGLGLTLLPVHYQFGGCDGRALNAAQQRFGNDIDRFARLHGAAAAHIRAARADDRIGVAPHSLRAVSPDGLSAAQALSGDGPIHIHVAEQTAEVDEVLAHHGARPVQWLLDTQPVDARWCLIHCTQMLADEVQALARTQAVAGLCPITEANLGDGIFPAVDFLAHSGRFGVGTDSNVQIALFEELRLLEYAQRLRDRGRALLAERGVSTARLLFDQVTRAGAQAAARPSGALVPGLWADLLSLSRDNEHLDGLADDRLLDTLVFGAAGSQCIRDVWSAGRHIVRNGQHIQREAIVQRYRAVLRTLRQTL